MVALRRYVGVERGGPDTIFDLDLNPEAIRGVVRKFESKGDGADSPDRVPLLLFRLCAPKSKGRGVLARETRARTTSVEENTQARIFLTTWP